MRSRRRPHSAGPSTRRHRRASRRVVLALEWLEVRWVPSGVGVGSPPVVSGITNDGPVEVGTPVTLTVSAHDAPGVTGPLTYQFDFFDTTIHHVVNTTGVASWTYDVPGRQFVAVHVTDSQGSETDVTTSLVVTPPAPAVTAPADQPAVEGSTTEFALGRFTEAGGHGSWHVTVDWGDDTPGSTFVVTAPGDLGSLPHTCAKYGNYNVRVTVDDGQSSDSAQFTADVADVRPAVTAPSDQPASEGTATSFALGQLGDPGSDSPWMVAVDWGDNTAPSTFIMTTAGDLGSWPHTYAKYGNYAVTVTVDDGQLSGSAIFDADVADVRPAVTAPGDQAATEGSSSSFALGQFADPGSDSPWIVTVDWGDNSAPSTFTATSPGDLGSLPHTYAKYGDYTVAVTVDDGRLSGSATFGADVAKVVPAVKAPADQAATEGSAASFALGGFTDIGAESPWHVTVDWGDGWTPTVFGAGATGDLGSEPHTYAKYGTYQVTVSVNDGLATGSASFHVAVADAAPLVTAASGQPASEGTTTSFALGQFADPGSDSPWMVTVDWGDRTPATTFNATTIGDLGSLPHDYATYGTYVVTITVNDGRDAGSSTFLANVTDVPPSVTAPAGQTEALGTTESFALGQFSDPGADLLWVVTVDWGDHSTPTEFLATSPGDLGSLAHEFRSVGSYTVTVTVADGRESGSASFQAAVTQATPTSPPPGPPENGTPPGPTPPIPPIPFDPLSLLADVTSVSVFLAVGPTGQFGETGTPGVNQIPTRVAQSFLSMATSLVVVLDDPGAEPQGAAGAKGAGGAATPSAVPVVFVEVSLPANPFAPAATTTTTTTTTTTASGGTAPAATFFPSSPPDLPNPGGGAVTTVILVIAFMNQQQVPRSGVFSFSRSARRSNLS